MAYGPKGSAMDQANTAGAPGAHAPASAPFMDGVFEMRGFDTSPGRDRVSVQVTDGRITAVMLVSAKLLATQVMAPR